MAEGPTTRRRQVGFRLKDLRDGCGLTAEEAGERAGVSKATVSRYERGTGEIKWNQVEALCRAYQASDEEREALVALAKASSNAGAWWISKEDPLDDKMRLLIALENEATRIRQYQAVFVPGLLQTRAYGEAIAVPPGQQLDAPTNQRYLNVRRKRQELLIKPEAPAYHVILDESVLLRAVGGPAVISEQLDLLLERAAAPNFTLQVLPLASGGFSAANSSFLILGGADPALDVIYSEQVSGALFLEQPHERKKCAEAFAHLSEVALGPGPSADLIAEASKMHRRN
ncbi:helix-turn-helix domain-containing protein [Streptomyces stramineus]|uniref:Helix-turn-helix transcriptional regulator n=1 Tax=Streptomyces stramineus TaxID=173861 RepID=A0ABP3KHP6_9ACTN